MERAPAYVRGGGPLIPPPVLRKDTSVTFLRLAIPAVLEAGGLVAVEELYGCTPPALV